MSALLIVLAGLPGSGKTTLARALAARLGATHLRIDTIEQTLRRAGLSPQSEGYDVANAQARDQLRLGHGVVADAVNGVQEARLAWRATAADACAPLLEIEVRCSDVVEHRRRVEARRPDIEGLVLPDWDKVRARHYEAWDRPPLVVDTAHRTVEACVADIVQYLPGGRCDGSVQA